ncbi:MAG: BtpA/SgcQ family protein [Deltaproteobacteria bacterium]|nr:BtpA/SgcQ family protein [Deltaproteobacteria bacterium]
MLRGLIGVIHLPAMPGDPKPITGGFAEVEKRALIDAEAWAAGGARALIVENFGSAPFWRGDATSRIPPHQVAAMALIVREVASATELPVGVNCLRNDAMAALGIAAAADLDFIRVNVHVGAYITDQGLIQGEAADTLRYRATLAAKVKIFADVLVKHAAPLGPLDPGVATEECLERGLADGVIVTGEATGAPVSKALLQQVRQASGRAPVYIGSGLTISNAADLAPFADGAIVGTACKEQGDVTRAVDPERVRALVEATTKYFGDEIQGEIQ